MFTGIIRHLGTVQELAIQGENATLRLASDPKLVQSLAAGDSIAINGACLTVLSQTDQEWTHHLMVETLERTNLGHLKSGDQVNLEQPLAVGERLDGHFVMGHIDGVAEVTASRKQSEDTLLTFQPSTELMPLIIPKGSIALDGTSLTVVDTTTKAFTVSLFPYTLEHTIFGQIDVGYQANIEVDMIGKYVQRLLSSTKQAP